MPILEIKNLTIHFHTDAGVVQAVNHLSLTLEKGEVLGMVGESGCGKSVTALSIMRLLLMPPARVVTGEILFEGRNLLALDSEEMRKIRGNRISMIFQEPMTSLNPVFTVGDQIAEAVMAHQNLMKKEAMDKTVQLLKSVQIPSPEQRISEYPHQLSGGMRQRVMIAMALSGSPSILIADEPTTALDVTIQAQILDLMSNIREESDMSILMITHDLGVIAEMADRTVVMYAGEVVEHARTVDLFQRPCHPYTIGLMQSIPRIGSHGARDRLKAIPGTVSDLIDVAPWCKFSDRCVHVTGECRQRNPDLVEMESGHFVRCFKHVGVVTS
ncbi:MAG: peptide ABC transporter ATP-binding protein [Nitrospirae bacterium CG_4_10_14_3_um_filter_53_41]|nr:MAG: peptide ABC transporter ATP-binding protein [Nitrospirae bacterium CG2_30_53_67]PIV85839.1 MAG: peptide ABC transporter ATP-binding protein [Nitrospirae bacterium CG17_big_fil_post_rev_8_21_14_2_50_50_9]PIW84868.1 MAG: peptide ABC transporter ATP-binding protein [Nitrospirae bacterium CG_4_8_14_3_um_filter_50_41]PIX85390.1 MAG: peptide ABC transporter ATP-binding protein [Nitrospirae bacterium CG_4_10_14_3_um_filter_53_41]